MKIAGIRINNSVNLSFGRRLTDKEKYDYRNNVLQPAFDYLGTEEVSMILHGTCFPESENDIGVGSPYGSAAAKLLPFEILHGFNSNQLGPVGVIRDAQNISPYKSTIETKNYLFLDIEKLTTPEYANILTEEDLEFASQKTYLNGKNYSYSSFADAFANYRYCIKIANDNFKQKIKKGNQDAIALNKEFTAFKKEKGNILKTEALFDILSNMYGTKEFAKWDDLDRNLITRLRKRDPIAIERYQKIVTRSKDDFETYLLGQFLVNKQVKENTALRKNLNFKYISDLLVGFSASDEWANQDLFLRDYRMGCPYGGKYGPQLWDIPVLDPNKLFIGEHDLGSAGKYLKQKLEACLNDFDNTRVDHALGLIDPYIYDKNSVEIVNGKINMDKFKGNNISNMSEVDYYGNFKHVLNRIIIPTLEEHGINKNYPVWEDLCATTPVFNDIYYAKNNLPGITQLEWMRAEECQDEHDWGLVGSHDSDPALKMIKKDWVRNGDSWNIFYLAGFLNSNPKRAQYRDSFCKNIADSDSERVKAKFAELFLTCKKIQISFADFFGIDKTYNKGGKENNTNWKLRLNKDYEDTYYKNLASEHPTAINLPEVLKIAVQAKSDRNAVNEAHKSNLSDNDIPANNDENVQQILDKLDKYEKILKEPE